MSTPYQILFSDKNLIMDIENTNRFYKARDISNTPQSEWLYQIFKDSMNAKIKSLGFCVMIFISISIVYYEVVIQTIAVKKPALLELTSLHHKLVVSDDEEEILKMLERSREIYWKIEKDAETLYAVFLIIEILCILNLSFFTQNIIEFLFTRIMGRFY